MAELRRDDTRELRSTEREQLERYAEEFQQHYREERRLRQELEWQNSQLEQRVRELAALNNIIQEHIDERSAVVDAYRELLEGLEQVSRAGAQLVERAKTQKILDLQLGFDDWAESAA